MRIDATAIFTYNVPIQNRRHTTALWTLGIWSDHKRGTGSRQRRISVITLKVDNDKKNFLIG